MPNPQPKRILARVAVRLAAGVLLSLTPALVAAQSCAGVPIFDAAKFAIKGIYQTGEDVSGIGAGTTLKVGERSFLDVEYVRNSAKEDDVDVGSHNVAVMLGFPTTAKRPEGWRLCPIVGFTAEVVDDVEFLGETIEASAWAIMAGVSTSRRFGDATGVSFSPFGSARLAYSRATISFGGFEGRETQELGLLQAGVGIAFTPTVALTPSVVAPIFIGKPDFRFGLTFTVAVP